MIPANIAERHTNMDEFDLIDSIEEQYIAEGHAEGVKEGRRLGFLEGKDLGEVKGYEIGSEVGFYYGCFLLWSEILRIDPTQLPTKAEKSIKSLGQLIEGYKLENSLDEKMLHNLQLIRAKFKVVTSLVSQKQLVFNETTVYEHKNMSF
ncbi:Aste57867_20545 [Aphanomyces stellatus]|uniref:Aste57867_20545 protein n=1 Tax=Aphanomyces stellatus TaxID=120398 RepID=A0A485LF77_9STRA|nr:hypothetical protein As57867_020478 [Aphanomyces stellatus]VFT97230.1 Aste57867_20545 [Aphanomyces stellatus]